MEAHEGKRVKACVVHHLRVGQREKEGNPGCARQRRQRASALVTVQRAQPPFVGRSGVAVAAQLFVVSEELQLRCELAGVEELGYEGFPGTSMKQRIRHNCNHNHRQVEHHRVGQRVQLSGRVSAKGTSGQHHSRHDAHRQATAGLQQTLVGGALQEPNGGSCGGSCRRSYRSRGGGVHGGRSRGSKARARRAASTAARECRRAAVCGSNCVRVTVPAEGVGVSRLRLYDATRATNMQKTKNDSELHNSA